MNKKLFTSTLAVFFGAALAASSVLAMGRNNKNAAPSDSSTSSDTGVYDSGVSNPGNAPVSNPDPVSDPAAGGAGTSGAESGMGTGMMAPSPSPAAIPPTTDTGGAGSSSDMDSGNSGNLSGTDDAGAPVKPASGSSAY